MQVTTIQGNLAADLLQMRSVLAIGVRGGYEIMIEELGIPDLDLIKQAQQGGMGASRFAGCSGDPPASRKLAATRINPTVRTLLAGEGEALTSKAADR